MSQMAACGSVLRAGKVVVVGLGNPYRTDDGVGIEVIRRLEGAVEAEVWEAARGGLPLAQALLGYSRVLVVDAAPFLPAGEVSLVPLAEIPRSSLGREGPHGLGLAGALSLLSRSGLPVPECWALAIGVPPDPPFGEGLSQEVSRAVPRAVAEVMKWLTS